MIDESPPITLYLVVALEEKKNLFFTIIKPLSVAVILH